jgi:hypothetical protein
MTRSRTIAKGAALVGLGTGDEQFTALDEAAL